MFRLPPAIALVIIAGLLALAACSDRPTVPAGMAQVRVLAEDGSPLVNALVVTEMGSGRPLLFSNVFYTNWFGVTFVPEEKLYAPATIRLDNYRPRRIASLEPTTYRLSPAPERLRDVGPIEGDPVLLESGVLATLTHIGGYRCYAFDEQSIRLRASADLRSHEGKAVVDRVLWISTAQDGVYGYSLHLPEVPVQTHHIPEAGDSARLAASKELLAVGGGRSATKDTLLVYGVDQGGGYDLLARIIHPGVASMEFRGMLLISLGGHEGVRTVQVVNLALPEQPEVLGLHEILDVDEVILWYPYLVSRRRGDHHYFDERGRSQSRYELLSLTDPRIPADAGTLIVEGILVDPVHDRLALGWDPSGASLVVYRGSPGEGVRAVAFTTAGGLSIGEKPGVALPWLAVWDRLLYVEVPRGALPGAMR